MSAVLVGVAVPKSGPNTVDDTCDRTTTANPTTATDKINQSKVTAPEVSLINDLRAMCSVPSDVCALIAIRFGQEWGRDGQILRQIDGFGGGEAPRPR